MAVQKPYRSIKDPRKRYYTTDQFYATEYPKKYYNLTQAQLEIDPNETVEDMDRYSIQRREQELLKCAESFSYFCHKYVKIGHPVLGLIPFVLFKYQDRVIEHYETKRFNIISKFRQGGLTTVTVLWCLWRCMFMFNETIMLLSKSDREAIAAGEILRRALDFFPTWLKPNMSKSNEHEQSFSDTGSKMFFYTPNAARGRSITYLILDEAAFIPNMESHWKAMYPTIATGGNCIAVSTVNGIGNWYEKTYRGAQMGKNPFNIIELDYNEHPDYDNDKWVKETRANLGEKGWQQEVLRSFLGSGATYIPLEILKGIAKRVSDVNPIRKLFPELNNMDGMSQEMADDWEDKGALWIFREPIDGREYIIGVDSAEGVGEDNSCMQVIDSQTCEQVAEFYSNCCPCEKFARIVEQVAIFYNNALVVVENMGPGHTVLSKLQNDLYYENLYFDNVKNMEKAGVKMNQSNRPVILEAMQNRLLNDSLPINSKRLSYELSTFIWNKTRHRAEADKDQCDDAIWAMCHAIYVRDQQMRQVAFVGTSSTEVTDTFRTEIYKQIKEELAKGRPEDWIDPSEREIVLADKDESEWLDDFISRHRRQDALLREFGF